METKKALKTLNLLKTITEHPSKIDITKVTSVRFTNSIRSNMGLYGIPEKRHIMISDILTLNPYNMVNGRNISKKVIDELNTILEYYNINVEKPEKIITTTEYKKAQKIIESYERQNLSSVN